MQSTLPPHPPPPPPPPPPADEIPDGGDANVYANDEEEVEEVIEEIIEEEIEEEEESGKDDNYEFSNLSDYDHEDASQDIKSKGLDGKMIPHTPEEHGANKPLTHSVEGSIDKFKFSSTSDEQLTPEKEESHENCSNYRYLNSDSHFDNAARQVTPESATNSKVNVARPSNQTPKDSKPNCVTSSGSSNNESQGVGIRRQSNVAGKDAVVVPVSREQPDALKYLEESEQMGNVDGKKRTILSAPEGLTRSRLSDTGIDNGNKRPAIICDFYARGWCIKGSSCRFLHIKETSMTTAHTSKYTFKPSLPAGEILPSHKTSSWMASSFDSGFSSLKGMASYSQSLLSGSIDFRTPKYLSLHTSSSFFGSEAAKPPLTNAIGRQSCPAQLRTKFIPYNWEASIPFRPSFCVSSIQGATSGSLRNSSELLNLGDGTYSSCYTQGASTLNATDRIHSNSVTGIAGKCNDDKHSASSHDRNNGKVVENECYTHKLKLPIGADVEGNSVVDGQSGTAPREDKPLDFAESHNVTRQSDVLGNRTELVASRDKQKYTTASEQEEDVDVQKESEVLQHFRAALIDFVKDLVKPTWREGRLSRDAHKIIVKKASDKVISTLQFNQIPASTDSIKLFFASSRTKIMKLVEGYVDKYGKL